MINDTIVENKCKLFNHIPLLYPMIRLYTIMIMIVKSIIIYSSLCFNCCISCNNLRFSSSSLTFSCIMFTAVRIDFLVVSIRLIYVPFLLIFHLLNVLHNEYARAVLTNDGIILIVNRDIDSILNSPIAITPDIIYS